MTKTFDKNLFRFIYSLLLASLLAIAGTSLYRYASSPTDENIFATTPGKFYLTTPTPVYITDNDDASVRPDTMQVGDILLSIDKKQFYTVEEMESYLAGKPATDTLKIAVFRPISASKYVYRLTRRELPDSAFREIPASVYVMSVRPGGASDRGGLKKGDLITRINGREFENSREADQILRDVNRTGLEIDYLVIRNNREIQLQIKLAKVGIHLSAIFLILTGLVYLATGAFIALSRPQYKAARLIGFVFLALGFFLAAVLRRDVEYDTFALLRDIMIGLSIYFSPALWLHLGHYFPREHPAMLKRRWILLSSYGITVLFIIVGILVKKPFVGNTGLALLVLYNVVVSFRCRKAVSEEYRSIHRFIWRTTLGAAVIVVLLIVSLYYTLPINEAYLADGSLFMITLSSVLIFIPLLFLYTIGQYRLLDLDIRVRRNVQYNLASIAWIIILLTIYFRGLLFLPTLNFEVANIQIRGTSLVVTDDPLTPEEINFYRQLVVMLAAIVFSFLLWKIAKVGQRLIDRKFFRSQSDFRQAARELTEVMSTQFSLHALAEGIVHKLADLLKVKTVGIFFLRDEQDCCCKKVYGMEEVRWEEFCAEMLGHITGVVRNNPRESLFSTEYLPGMMRHYLNQSGVRHLIAIRSKEKLLGVLLVGEKLSESPFHKEDLTFLGTVAKQTSVALENAFLYENLSEQERLKNELEIARKIQLASLPQTTPRMSGLEIAGISIPAQEVGGDYFDYLNGPPEEITVIIGDVSGKGTSAALYMSKIQGIMRSLHDFGLSPGELLVRANQLLIKDMDKSSFVTVMGAYFVTTKRQIKLARAGHLPLFHYQSDRGEVCVYTPAGIGLGLADSRKFAAELDENLLTYQPGDIFLFVTDGITEAQNEAGQEFGEQRLIEHLKNVSEKPAKRIRDHLISEVNQFADGQAQHDDLTVVVVKAV